MRLLKLRNENQKTLFSPRNYKWTKNQIQIVLFSFNYSNYWNNSNYLLQLWFDWMGGFDLTMRIFTIEDRSFRSTEHITCLFYGDNIVILKIILSPCFVNIFDGDKIPNVIFLNVDKIVPLLSTY